MNNITDVMNEVDRSQLSIIHLKQNSAKEVEFWMDFWKSNDIHGKSKTPEKLVEFTKVTMPLIALVEFMNTIRNKDFYMISDKHTIQAQIIDIGLLGKNLLEISVNFIINNKDNISSEDTTFHVTIGE